MYCRRCNVTVDCQTDVCPLCGQSLEKRGETTKPNLPSPKGSVKRQRLDIFSKVYIPLALIVIISCVVANVLTNPDFMWSIMVIVGLVYVFFCVRFTFIAQGNFNARIFRQVVILTLIFVIVRVTVGGNHWVFITWLPIVYTLSDILLGVYFMFTKKTSRSRLASMFVLAFLGIIPVCAAYILNLEVKWPSIAASAFSALIMLVLIITEHKQILSQIKRFFHL